MDLIKKALAKLGLIKLVWLRDFRGEIALRIKRKYPFGGYYACWYDFGIGTAILNEDGTCGGASYVKEWKDYE